MAATILDPRQLPLVELLPIRRIDVDGIVEHVTILEDDFVTTFFRLMAAIGSTELVRVPVLEVRRKLRAYTPNFLNALLMEERKRLDRGCAAMTGTVVPLH